MENIDSFTFDRFFQKFSPPDITRFRQEFRSEPDLFHHSIFRLTTGEYSAVPQMEVEDSAVILKFTSFVSRLPVTVKIPLRALNVSDDYLSWALDAIECGIHSHSDSRHWCESKILLTLALWHLYLRPILSESQFSSRGLERLAILRAALRDLDLELSSHGKNQTIVSEEVRLTRLLFDPKVSAFADIIHEVSRQEPAETFEIPTNTRSGRTYRPKGGVPGLFRTEDWNFNQHFFDPWILYYEFSNGKILNHREIFRDRLIECVPGDLLPNPGVHEFISGSDGNEARILSALLVTLAMWERHALSHKVQVALVSGPAHSYDRARSARLFSVSSLEVVKGSRFQIGIDSSGLEHGLGHFRIQILEIPDTALLFSYFAYDPSSQKLFLYSHHREFQFLADLFDNQSRFSYHHTPQTCHPREYRVIGQQKLSDSYFVLSRERKKEGFELISQAHCEKIVADQLRFKIHLADQGLLFGLEFKSADQNFAYLFAPAVFSTLFNIAADGLRSFSIAQFDELRDRRYDGRDEDLRILRHIGVGGLFVTCFTSFVLRSESVEGASLKSITELENDFCNRMKVVTGLVASKKLRKRLFSAIEKLVTKIEKAPLLAFGDARIFELEGANRLYLQFLEHWVREVAVQSKGDIFKKSNLKYFPSPLPPFHFVGEPLSGEDDDLIVRPQIRTPYLVKSTSDGSHILESFPRIPREVESGKFLITAPMWFSLLENQAFDFVLDGSTVNRLAENEFQTELKLQFNEKAALDWFEIHPKIFLKGRELQLSEIKAGLKAYYLEFEGVMYLIPKSQIPSVRKLEKFWEKMEWSKGKKTGQERASSVVELPRAQILDVLAAHQSGVKVSGDATWQSVLEFFDRLVEPKDSRGAAKFFDDTYLKPYQHIGARWFYDLYHLRLGGVLADEMGLGKTVQALAFLNRLHREKKLKRSLLVVPPTLLGHWISEAERFYPELPFLRFVPKSKAVEACADEAFEGCVITSYGLLTEHDDFFRSLSWNVQIFDEAQNLKNISAQRTSVARTISARSKFALTGTPLENRIEELFSLVDLVLPGALGSLKNFRSRFSPGATPAASEPLQELKQVIKPILLRRTKDLVLGQLPPKTETKVLVPFEARQQKLYRDIALSANTNVREQIDKLGEARTQIFMLTALLRLRQACSDPSALPDTVYPLVSPKLAEVLDLIQKIVANDESVLVFTQFVSTFNRLRDLAKKAGIQVFGIYGSLSQNAREKEIQGFKETKGPAVLIMTLKTGGVGLNLTKASFVIHVEPWWNPAVENQASDRAHRIGQTKPVTIYRLIVENSVEEKIEVLKARKAQLFESVMETSSGDEEAAQISGRLSQKDFEFLLGN